MNKEETTMPAAEWLNKYESMKEKLACKTDLDAHFTEKVIGSMAVDVLDIGSVHFPTGTIFACDPLVELEDIDVCRLAHFGKGLIALGDNQVNWLQICRRRCNVCCLQNLVQFFRLHLPVGVVPDRKTLFGDFK